MPSPNKFSGRGGDVLVEVRAVGARAEVPVKENGIGISPDSIPQLFARFRQKDASQQDAVGIFRCSLQREQLRSRLSCIRPSIVNYE